MNFILNVDIVDVLKHQNIRNLIKSLPAYSGIGRSVSFVPPVTESLDINSPPCGQLKLVHKNWV